MTMTEKEIANGFIKLGIIKPEVPANYSPELFGKQLLAGGQSKTNITYSGYTIKSQDSTKST